MTVVSNDPIWWSTVESNIIYQYFYVACWVVMVYDCALTFGQEYELVWRKRCSLMTVLYVCVRYAWILISVFTILSFPTVTVSDVGCAILLSAGIWLSFIANAMLGVIIITRLHVMCERSRQMLIFLIVTFLAVNITCAAMAAILSSRITGEEFILSGNHICFNDLDSQPMTPITWILGTVWEVLVLCIAVWAAVKHFRELRQFGPSKGSIIGDCFTVMIKTHVFYFAAFVAVSCFHIIDISGLLSNLDWTTSGTIVYDGMLQIVTTTQLFVLGPRLILDVREYHAKLLVNSDTASGMNSMAIQGLHISTGSDA